jgi:hypothetical protein
LIRLEHILRFRGLGCRHRRVHPCIGDDDVDVLDPESLLGRGQGRSKGGFEGRVEADKVQAGVGAGGKREEVVIGWGGRGADGADDEMVRAEEVGL